MKYSFNLWTPLFPRSKFRVRARVNLSLLISLLAFEPWHLAFSLLSPISPLRSRKNSLFAAQKSFFDHSNVRFIAIIAWGAPSFSRLCEKIFDSRSELVFPFLTNKTNQTNTTNQFIVIWTLALTLVFVFRIRARCPCPLSVICHLDFELWHLTFGISPSASNL